MYARIALPSILLFLKSAQSRLLLVCRRLIGDAIEFRPWDISTRQTVQYRRSTYLCNPWPEYN